MSLCCRKLFRDQHLLALGPAAALAGVRKKTASCRATSVLTRCVICSATACATFPARSAICNCWRFSCSPSVHSSKRTLFAYHKQFLEQGSGRESHAPCRSLRSEGVDLKPRIRNLHPFQFAVCRTRQILTPLRLLCSQRSRQPDCKKQTAQSFYSSASKRWLF